MGLTLFFKITNVKNNMNLFTGIDDDDCENTLIGDEVLSMTASTSKILTGWDFKVTNLHLFSWYLYYNGQSQAQKEVTLTSLMTGVSGTNVLSGYTWEGESEGVVGPR